MNLFSSDGPKAARIERKDSMDSHDKSRTIQKDEIINNIKKKFVDDL